jgi:hypothetical protein
MTDRVSESQIAFCKTHMAELNRVKFLNGEGE